MSLVASAGAVLLPDNYSHNKHDAAAVVQNATTVHIPT